MFLFWPLCMAHSLLMALMAVCCWQVKPSRGGFSIRYAHGAVRQPQPIAATDRPSTKSLQARWEIRNPAGNAHPFAERVDSPSWRHLPNYTDICEPMEFVSWWGVNNFQAWRSPPAGSSTCPCATISKKILFTLAY